LFATAARNTLVYSFGTVIPTMAIALGLALLLNARIRGRGFFRVAVYLPVVISWVAGALIWRLMFLHPDGIINGILGQFGIEPRRWTSAPFLSWLSLMWMSFWKSLAFFTVIYRPGPQPIPPTIHEAARIDGANNWQLFWSITLPLLRPTTLFALVIGVIGSFE